MFVASTSAYSLSESLKADSIPPSSVLSVLSTYQAAQPGTTILSVAVYNFTLPYISISMAENILITLLIGFRLISDGRRLQGVLGKSHGKLYTSITTTLVESAALTAASSILFIVPYALQHPIFTFVLVIHPQVMVRILSPMAAND